MQHFRYMLVNACSLQSYSVNQGIVALFPSTYLTLPSYKSIERLPDCKKRLTADVATDPVDPPFHHLFLRFPNLTSSFHIPFKIIKTLFQC